MSGAGISRSRRSLRPSRVTASSGLRQCQVYGPRPGLAKSRAVAAPAAVPTPLSRMSRQPTLTRGLQRGCRAVKRTSVTSAPLDLAPQPRRCHIAVVRTTAESHRGGYQDDAESRPRPTAWVSDGTRGAKATLGTLGINGAVSAAAGRWPGAARGQTSGGPGAKGSGRFRVGTGRGALGIRRGALARAGRSRSRALEVGGRLGQAVASARSSARLRVLLGSTGMPGPIVVVKVTFFRYRPLAAAGLSLITSSRAAA
jgi:hypothetical protein